MFRALGLIGLVLALLVVGLLAKKQLGGSPAQAIGVQPAPASSQPLPADVRSQSLQIQQQFKQSLDAAAQPRPMPDGQ